MRLDQLDLIPGPATPAGAPASGATRALTRNPNGTRCGRPVHQPMPRQLALELADPAAPVSWTQRWSHRRHSWRKTSEGGFDPRRYQVVEMPGSAAAAARRFVTTHHYSGSWPAVRLPVGLVERASGELVGVVAFGVPTNDRVLTSVFPTLAPNQASAELVRLVVADSVQAPVESWLVARACRIARQHGVRGVVAYSDPMPRRVVSPDGAARLVSPGHVGVVYQALNMRHLTPAPPRRIVILPDGSVLPGRTASKIRQGDPRGGRAAVERVRRFGARAPRPGEDLAGWLDEALEEIGARVERDWGKFRYALPLERRVQVAGAQLPYPKRRDLPYMS